MKKAITLFFLLASIAFVSSQSTNLEKQKAGIQKDTLKKNKATIELEESKTDSLLASLGKFKIYKKEAHASYYADKFNGRRTTSGRKFDNNK